MKLARFMWHDRAVYGAVEGDEILSISGSILSEFEIGAPLCTIEEVRFLPPVSPTLIVGVSLNYEAARTRHNRPMPEEPVLFLKCPTTVIGHLDPIVYPRIANDIWYEGELAVVMKKPAKSVGTDEAMDYILGYTCANDVTAMDLFQRDGNLTRSKNCDTFCPLGPFISIGISCSDLSMRTIVNGETCQEGNTGDMIFGVDRIISYISQFVTLQPGSVVLTGTPGGGVANVGDTIEIEIEHVGTLVNEVVAPR